MHGRQDTVKYCLDKMPFIDKVMIYTTTNDGIFLDSTDVTAKARYNNKPLSLKWNAAFMVLKELDFDGVIILGSDDYINEAFLRYAQKNVRKYDMIGFTDAYYEQDDRFYYWEGYNNKRNGEPVGAGKIYSKEFLERINYNLYPQAKNVGLDFMAHNVCLKHNAKMNITSLKKEGVFMCDVKDDKGMNSLAKLQEHYNLIEL